MDVRLEELGDDEDNQKIKTNIGLSGISEVFTSIKKCTLLDFNKSRPVN